jgi:hypothetical protein
MSRTYFISMMKDKDERIAELQSKLHQSELKTISLESELSTAIAWRKIADDEMVGLNDRLVELEKVLLATPETHSDEWSDYVCTFCSKEDGGHDEDCVHLLAKKLREKAKGMDS